MVFQVWENDEGVEDQSFFEIVKLEILLMKILTFNSRSIRL